MLNQSIRLTVWKWSGESRYPGALLLVLKNFRRAFSSNPGSLPLGLRGWGYLSISEDNHECNKHFELYLLESETLHIG